MITSQQLSERCTDNNRPTPEEIAKHFESTIFWNWCVTVDGGLDDEARIECEYPLDVSEPLADLEDDRAATQSIHFVSGELTMLVATMHYSRSDEAARVEDGHFIANLPVYIPALFRKLREQAEKIEELEATLEDEEAAHAETLAQLQRASPSTGESE